MTRQSFAAAATRTFAPVPALLLLAVGPLAAQGRPPSRPPAPPAPRVAAPAPRPVVAPPPRPAPPAAGPRVHGNAVAMNNRSQLVYGIYKTDRATGQTQLHKVGVSGGTTRPGSQLPKAQQRTVQAPTRSYSDRALRQTTRLNRDAGEAAKYSTRVLRRIPAQPAGGPTARQLALAAEKQVVTAAAVKRDVPPPGNKLPKPYDFSRLPKK